MKASQASLGGKFFQPYVYLLGGGEEFRKMEEEILDDLEEEIEYDDDIWEESDEDEEEIEEEIDSNDDTEDEGEFEDLEEIDDLDDLGDIEELEEFEEEEKLKLIIFKTKRETTGGRETVQHRSKKILLSALKRMVCPVSLVKGQ